MVKTDPEKMTMAPSYGAKLARDLARSPQWGLLTRLTIEGAKSMRYVHRYNQTRREDGAIVASRRIISGTIDFFSIVARDIAEYRRAKVVNELRARVSDQKTHRKQTVHQIPA